MHKNLINELIILSGSNIAIFMQIFDLKTVQTIVILLTQLILTLLTRYLSNKITLKRKQK